MKKVLLFLSAIVALSASALTYNVTVPAETKACYIAGEMNGWSQTEMTKVDATHYTIDIEGATTSQKYKYCSGPGWNYVEKSESGDEISDRTYSENDVVAKWAAVYDPGVGEETPEGDVTIYLEKSSAYTTTYLYAWGGGDVGAWPGMVMSETEVVEGVEYYKHTFVAPSKSVNIIFNDGGSNQTNDILGVVSTTFYRLPSTSGRVDAIVIEAGEGDGSEPETLTYNVTVPEGTPTCFIAGEMNGWSHAEMTKVDETHYTITYENVTRSMKYKYTASNGWDNVEMQADGVSDVNDRTYSANDVVAAWKGISAPVVGNETLTYNVTVPAGTNACYIVGEFNNWGEFVLMTMVDETHYTITLDNVSRSMQYKYTSGKAWDYVELNADGSEASNRTYNENDVVGAWKAIGEPDVPAVPETLTYNVTVPAGTNGCFIAGEMNEWTFTPMHKIDATHYTITLDNVTRAMKYKYCSGEGWEYVEMQADGVTDMGDRTYNENDVVAAWKAIGEGIYQPEDLTFYVEVPAGTNACYIAGEMTAWICLEMTQVDATHYTLTYYNILRTDKYQYLSGPDTQYQEVANGEPVIRTYSEYDIVNEWQNTWASVKGVENDNVTITGANGMMNIRSSEEVALNIYNAQGMLVKNVTVNGTLNINLNRGLYIVNNTKVLVY